MSALEASSYLTDATFVSCVFLVVASFAALELINRIGGAK